MRSTAETDSLRKRLDAAFERYKLLPPIEHELLADYAKYLCVLVSGYFETVVVELLNDYCRAKSSPQVVGYASRQLSYVQNLKSERLLQLLGSFSTAWRADLEKFIAGELKDALDSTVDLRNKIAHGENVVITYSRIRDYYSSIRRIVDRVAIIVE